MSYYSKEHYYPKEILLNKPNFIKWKHYIQLKMMDYPDLGLAIIKKKKYTIERPRRDDVFPGTSQRKYSMNPNDLLHLESTSMERYARDMDRYSDALSALKKEEALFCSFLRSSFSEEAQVLLRSDPRYVTANMSNSSYDLYFICEELHSCSSSFSTAQNALVSIFSISSTGSFQNPTPAAPTILAAVTASSSTSVCQTCSKEFQTVKSKITGKNFILCYQCNKKRQIAQDTKGTTTTPVVRPPTAKQVQIAHAVLLAAQSTNPAPVTPPPAIQPIHDANYLNSFIQNNGLQLLSSLRAHEVDVDVVLPLAGSFSPAPATSSKPWHMDSAASITCSDDINDLINPSILSAPLAIRGANGGILYATHVGHSHLSPLISVYFVPGSAVKLISLGALSRQGFTYSTGPDQSLTVLDPTRSILCKCSLQSNNVWTFPRHLMEPSSNKRIALPFLAPTDPIFFTKEEIKRAVLTRQLHDFLGHPNDEALKLVLDQGTFAQYSPLVPADVTIMSRLFGSCVSCAIGKIRYQDLHSDSTSSPSTVIGDKIFFDPQLLPCPSHGGNTHGVTFVDDFSHFVTVLGAKSKSHKALMECVTQLIAIYNSRGYKVRSLCSDSEATCQSLTTSLELIGCSISHTTPDIHCHKVERVIQEIGQKAVAIRAGLHYHLPPSLTLHLWKYCADEINLTAQASMDPAMNPYKRFYKTQPVLNPDPTKAFLTFGAPALIKLTDGQRTAAASKQHLNTNNLHKGTLAINLGTSIHHPGDNMFFTPDSPTLLPRKRWEPVAIAEPFGWKAQIVLQRTYLKNATPTANDIIQADDYPRQL